MSRNLEAVVIEGEELAWLADKGLTVLVLFFFSGAVNVVFVVSVRLKRFVVFVATYRCTLLSSLSDVQ